MGDLKNWQKLTLWAADHFPKNKLSQDLAYKIISDPQVGYQAGATTKDVARNVFSFKPKKEDTNKYMFVYGADTRRPETTIGYAYDWSEDIKENGYENVKTYNGVLNPYNEYLVDSRNKGLVEEFAKVGYSPVSNINNEYIDWDTYRLKQGTPYYDDVHSYHPTFHFNNEKPVISSSDLYDFGKNYIGNFTDLYVERSGNEKDPAFTMELQRRALNSVGQPYLLVQKNIPIRFVDNPQGNEIWRTNNFNKELRLDEMSDREISNILHTGYIEPAIITAYKKGGRIHIKKKNRGSFTRWCNGKVTAECIARGKRSKNPKIRKKATFAANARRWKHENGGILKAQEGTGNLWTPQPLSPVGIALNQAKVMAKMKGEHQHFPPGVKEVIGPDGKKVVIRTEQPLQPLEQNIAEWLPGTGDVAELGYIANDVKNSNWGSAALATGMIVLPGNIGKLFGKRKSRKIGKLDRDIPKGRRPEKVSKKVNLNENELSDGDIYFNGTSTAEDALQRQKLGESVIDDLVRGRTDSYSFDELPDDFLGEETPFKYLEPRRINYTFKDPSIFDARLDPEVSKPFLYYTKKGNIYRSKSPKIGSRQFDTFIQRNKWNDELPGLRIFDQYKSAMTRRRNYTWSGLIDQYNSGNAYGIEDMNGNALIGYPLFGKGLIASHFAPRTMRGGANLISRLNDNQYPVIFSVTEDLSPMLSKIGYKKLSRSIPQSFNGDIVQKQVFINRGFDPNLFLKKLGIKAKSTNFIEDIMSGEFAPETVEVLKPIILYKRGGIL